MKRNSENREHLTVLNVPHLGEKIKKTCANRPVSCVNGEELTDFGSPLGSNGDDRRQRRKQGGAVGAAASRMQATAKQTLGAATRPWRGAPERASLSPESRRAAISRPFVRAILSLRFLFFSVAALPSQSRSARQLPQRGSHWRVGPLCADR